MKFNTISLAVYVITASGGTIWAPSAFAQAGGPGFRGEVFGGVARDERPLNGNDTAFSGGILPSVTFGGGGPLTVQVDGMAARHTGDTVLAAGAHLGFRATESLSIGAYGAYAHFDGVPRLDSYRIGGEANYRAGRVTLSAIVGYEHSDRGSTVAGTIPGFTVIDTYGRGGSVFSMADISFYPEDSWSLTAGHRYVGRRHAAAAGTEKAFAGTGLSVFAEGRIGEGGYAACWAGLRIKLGGDRSSLRANDQAAFSNRLKDELFVPANSRQRTLVAPPAPPAPPSGGEGGCCGACYAT